MLPNGLEQLPLREILITVILTLVIELEELYFNTKGLRVQGLTLTKVGTRTHQEVCNKAYNVGNYIID